LVVAKEECQQARKDNQALARYINARRKKKEARKKEEEACKKVMEGQSSKDVQN
jgi:hypothetical protein